MSAGRVIRTAATDAAAQRARYRAVRDKGGACPCGCRFGGRGRLALSVDRTTGCWTWLGAFVGGMPRLFAANLGRASARGWIIEIARGEARGSRGQSWHPTCRNFRCVNPEHLSRAFQVTTRAYREKEGGFPDVDTDAAGEDAAFVEAFARTARQQRL